MLVQCPFTSKIQGQKQQGHGEHVYASELLYDYLNNQVISASLEEGEVLVLGFEGKKY